MTFQFLNPSQTSLLSTAGIGLQDRDAWTPLYSDVDLSLDRDAGIYWCHLQPQSRPSVTPELLRDVTSMQSFLRNRMAQTPENELPFKYFVVASRSTGIFNLGGDLRLFADAVRKGHKLLLQKYAHSCVDIVWNNVVSYDQPVVTMALVQGDALGGGFETALSCNVIVAERSARFGLPEMLFGLFPGMGAYSILSRKLGRLAAERMILSGKVFTAEEMFDMGIVHTLVEDGEGEAAVRDFVARNRPHHAGHVGVYEAGRRVDPLHHDELKDIVENWAASALKTDLKDIRMMRRLASAQTRLTK